MWWRVVGEGRGKGGEEVSEMVGGWGGEGGREGGRGGEEEGQRNEAVLLTIREYLTKKRGRSGMENSATGARVVWRRPIGGEKSIRNRGRWEADDTRARQGGEQHRG